jgi:hypothetical protein
MANLKTKVAPEGEETVLKVLAETAIGRGLYANFALISHTKEEFILDFILRFANQNQLVSRIILSPSHAQRLEAALADNIKRWKSYNGKQVTTIKPTKFRHARKISL